MIQINNKIFFLLFFFFFMYPLVGQIVDKERMYPYFFKEGSYPLPVGSVNLLELTLEEKSDSLHLAMKLYVVAKAMNDFQSWRILPEIKNGEYSLLFPYILINGKVKNQLYQRRLSFNDERLSINLPLIKKVVGKRKGYVIHYHYSMPYESWMDNANLCLHQILTSCADEEQWFSLEDISGINLEEHETYVPHVIVNYIEPKREEKIRRMQGEAFLDFESGRSRILPQFRRNPEELRKINESVREISTNPDIRITGLQVEGFASPEGSYESNRRLSLDRAAALKEYLEQEFSLPSSLFDVRSEGEDWKGLRELVEKSDIAQRERILAVIDSSDSPDSKEQQLKVLGNVYAQLLRDYFPSLRRVRYQVDYMLREYTVSEAAELLDKNPGHLSAAELFTIAETYERDSEKWHQILTLTVLLYPDDKEANINAAGSLLQRGDAEGAWRYLKKLQEVPEAYHNVGVYHLITGNPDEAERYFKQSIGIVPAIENLSEVQKVREDLIKQERRKKR